MGLLFILAIVTLPLVQCSPMATTNPNTGRDAPGDAPFGRPSQFPTVDYHVNISMQLSKYAALCAQSNFFINKKHLKS